MGKEKPPKGAEKDAVTYLFLIEDTEKGTVQSAVQRKKEINGVSKVVKKEGGQCSLYSTRGSPFDYVSVITGITGAVGEVVGIGRGAFSGNMRVSFQAARSIG